MHRGDQAFNFNRVARMQRRVAGLVLRWASRPRRAVQISETRGVGRSHPQSGQPTPRVVASKHLDVCVTVIRTPDEAFEEARARDARACRMAMSDLCA